MPPNGLKSDPDVAYLIAAHAEPLLLARQVRALSAPWARIFIHIDAAAAIAPFRAALAGLDVVLLEDRVRVEWGGFSQVEASLRMMRAALATGAARHVLLSGVCYPLVGNAALRDAMMDETVEFIEAFAMPNRVRDKPITRLSRWSIEGGRRRKGTRAAAIRLLNAALRVVPQRDVEGALQGLRPQAGSNWWALTRKAVQHIFETLEARPALVALYRYSLCPDESLFQTILANSRFAPRLAGTATFADWSNGARSPRLLTPRHLDWLLDGAPPPAGIAAGKYLFARKFSPGDESLLDRIDAARNANRASAFRWDIPPSA